MNRDEQIARAKARGLEVRPLGYFAAGLNDGQRTGFKVGDAVSFENDRGRVHRGVVVGPGKHLGEIVVTADGGAEWVIRSRRPRFGEKRRMRLRPARDARGRFVKKASAA